MTTVLDRPTKQRNGKVSIVGTAAIYIRVSTDRQREEGASLGVQREACLRYCESHGLVVVAEFLDVLSGLDASRPQYMQAVELARANDIDKLVVWRLDRLGRDSAEYIPLLKELRRLGVNVEVDVDVDVVSVTQPTESIFMQQVIGIMAEEESRQLSIRVTASKQRRFSEGKWGSPAPFGYENQKHPEGGTVLSPNTEAPTVTEIFERYAGGKHSLSDLRNYLNENGHLKSRYAISYILKNPVYLGILQHGQHSRSQFFPKPDSTESQGKHQPLVDRETFDKVQGRLAANKNRGRGGVRPQYLFSGLIRCGGCDHKYVGRTATGRHGKTWVEYRCNRRHSFGDCGASSVYETRIRAMVIPPVEALLRKLRQEDIRAAVREELAGQRESLKAAHQQTREGLAETQSRLEARLTRLEDRYLDGDLSQERYLVRRDEILAKLQEIQASKLSNPAPVAPNLTHLFTIADSITVESLDDEAWREIIEGMVDRIVIEGADGDGRKAPASIRVEWKAEFQHLLDTVTEG